MESTTKYQTLTTIYNSRQNVLEIMEANGFATDKYKGFSMNEVTAMIATRQLDMLLETTTDEVPRKVYVSFYLDTLNAPSIYSLTEELFEVSGVLAAETDTLFIINKTKITDSISKEIKQIWANKGILVVVVTFPQLQFNILKHELVPKPNILTAAELLELNKRYATDKLAQISRFDPVAQVICIRPGQVVRFLRGSETAIVAPYYRRCVEAM